MLPTWFAVRVCSVSDVFFYPFLVVRGRLSGVGVVCWLYLSVVLRSCLLLVVGYCRQPWGSPHSSMGETGVRIDCELLVDFLQNQKPQITQLLTFADFCHQC